MLRSFLAGSAVPLAGSGFYQTAGSWGKEMKSRSVFPSSPPSFHSPSPFILPRSAHTHKNSRGFPCQAKLDAIQNRNAGEGKRKKEKNFLCTEHLLSVSVGGGVSSEARCGI